MPGFLDSAFDQLDKQIQLTEEDRMRFSIRANEVRDLLVKSTLIAKCTIIGSLTRNTALREHSDVDLLAEIKPNENNSAARPDQVLQAVAKAISKYDWSVSRGSIAVTVNYSNKPSVDVLPARTSSSGSSFLIPDYGNHWQSFEPSKLDDLVKQSTNKLGSNVRQLIRLLKYWNHKNDVGLISSDIEEIVCLLALRHRTAPEHTRFMTEFFEFVIEWSKGSKEADEAVGRRFRSTSAKRARTITRNSLTVTLRSEESMQGQNNMKELFGA